jgi:hypothetical protein
MHAPSKQAVKIIWLGQGDTLSWLLLSTPSKLN